ncbi:MAG TPA: hypothetical protein VH593_11820 [Ktedonobacteraceae bacterium]|jgi:hypothetical protein
MDDLSKVPIDRARGVAIHCTPIVIARDPAHQATRHEWLRLALDEIGAFEGGDFLSGS